MPKKTPFNSVPTYATKTLPPIRLQGFFVMYATDRPPYSITGVKISILPPSMKLDPLTRKIAGYVRRLSDRTRDNGGRGGGFRPALARMIRRAGVGLARCCRWQ